jgi:uncharacterized protein (TIGR00730 family)
MTDICVFASSSPRLATPYYEAAAALGRGIAERGWGVVFGGGTDGLMGALARGAAEKGGRITGIIPDMMNVPGVAFEGCTELIATRTMRERKAEMEARADAFVALPGGFGTLEEILEIITLRQLGYHTKPVALVNTLNFYGDLQELFSRITEQHFASPESLCVFGVLDTPEETLQYIETAQPVAYVKNALYVQPAKSNIGKEA